jgi:hypothetical protein
MNNPQQNYRYIKLWGQDEKGKSILSVIAKRTYKIVPNDRCVPSSIQEPLTIGDTYFDNGDSLTASCEQESDLIPFKTSTDVVLNGFAHAPENKPVRELPVGIQIGDTSKYIYITGNRTCIHRMILDPIFTEPEPFTTMALRYENAYGGTDVRSSDSMTFMYPRNPIGKGFVMKKKKYAIDGLELPNLEDPAHLVVPDGLAVEKIKHWQDFPVPQSFGWYNKAWFPRVTYAGVMQADTPTYDGISETSSAEYGPKNFVESFKQFEMPVIDFRFFNGASFGLSLPFLCGSETVRLQNLDPYFPDLRFQLPDEKPSISIDIGEGPREAKTVLHTLMIFKEKNRVCLTWRGAVPYNGPKRPQYFKDSKVKVE